MLELINITAGYGKNIVLKGLNLQAETGSIHGLLGLNGSGKTTLLNLIAGSVKLINGEIKWNNCPIRNNHLAYLDCENYFYPYISGWDYLQLFSYYNKKFSIDEWNSLFKLPLDERIDSYSTGMKKKLAIFGVVALDRPLLLFDEPFNGLDIEFVETFKRLCLSLKNTGKTLIVTSHILESLTGICDKIYYLKDGVIAHSFGKSDFQSIHSVLFSQSNQRLDEELLKLLNQK